MKEIKRLILPLLLLCFGSPIFAQEGHIYLGTRVGNSATFGNFAALALEAEHNFVGDFTIGGGIMRTSYERLSAELRPCYNHSLEFGELHLGALLHLTSQSNLQSFALGGGVGLTIDRFFLTFGYYYRTLSNSAESLAEPFNLYYEFGFDCLPSARDWDLKVTFSNCRHFDLERHYQPSLAADALWRISDGLALSLGVCYKPSGIFHISSDYYQIYTNFGLCYRW